MFYAVLSRFTSFSGLPAQYLRSPIDFLVRSYGTEDRAAEKQVGPRSEVYEYIVFRGSDIKDLHVSKAPLKPRNTVNQDPSILQVCNFVYSSFRSSFTGDDACKVQTIQTRIYKVFKSVTCTICTSLISKI